MQYDRSLLTVDILGAQPKMRNQYMNRLLPNQLRFQEQLQLQQFSSFYLDNKSLNKIISLAEGDISTTFIIFAISAFHKEKIISKEQTRDTMKFQKDKSNNTEHWRTYMISPRQIDADRLLCTNDIDGAVPGSLQSKAVRNQEIAQKLRSQRNEERNLRNRELYHSQIDQTTTPQMETPERNKSYSVQPMTENRLKLPPISDRVDTVTNPVTNKLQLRQQRNYLLEDQEKTLRLLQKQTPLRLFI